MKNTDFTKALTGYFSTHLITTRGLSPNTISSYRDTFKLLLTYLSQKQGIYAERVEFKILGYETIVAFLDWLETSRNASVATRNQRQAALQAFFRYAQYQYPENIANCQDIIRLRPKKHAKPMVPFLTEKQVEALFAQPDLHFAQGRRDLTLLVVLYDSGARVQELADLNLCNVRLQHPARIILTGKGNKSRQVPLIKNTCKLLNQYMKEFHSTDPVGQQPLFFNATGERLSRSGITYILKKYAAMAAPTLDPNEISPHVLRHTKAMHLLQAGVNLIYIRDFLGHVDITTTEIYARIDAEMKRKVFEKAVPNYIPGNLMPWEEDENLMQWLCKLGKPQF